MRGRLQNSFDKYDQVDRVLVEKLAHKGLSVTYDERMAALLSFGGDTNKALSKISQDHGMYILIDVERAHIYKELL